MSRAQRWFITIVFAICSAGFFGFIWKMTVNVSSETRQGWFLFGTFVLVFAASCVFGSKGYNTPEEQALEDGDPPYDSADAHDREEPIDEDI
jgi:hypothetical protein